MCVCVFLLSFDDGLFYGKKTTHRDTKMGERDIGTFVGGRETFMLCYAVHAVLWDTRGYTKVNI